MMMYRWCLVLISCTVLVDANAIPIWELLSHEEKMGRLFYVFVHLVKQYCKTSDIPDCQKVLTLYGISNLVSQDEHSLDLMDPYQRDAKIIVWEKIMRGEFKFPIKSIAKVAKEHVSLNEVYSVNHEIRVRPPTNFVAPTEVRMPLADSSDDLSTGETNKKLLLLKGGRFQEEIN